MNWNDIIKTIGTNAVFLAILGFVARSIFNQLLSRDVEKFKIELQSTNDKELARLRSELERTTFEHQTRFVKLYDKRAEVIGNIYPLIIDAEARCISLAPTFLDVPEVPEEKLISQAFAATRDLGTYFDRNRLYLDTELCSDIDTLLKKLSTSSLMFQASKLKENESNKERIWNEGYQEFINEVPKVKSNLEKKFRELLGE